MNNMRTLINLVEGISSSKKSINESNTDVAEVQRINRDLTDNLIKLKNYIDDDNTIKKIEKFRYDLLAIGREAIDNAHMIPQSTNESLNESNDDNNYYVSLNIANDEGLYNVAIKTKNPMELKKMMMNNREMFVDLDKINWNMVDWFEIYNDL